MGIENKGFQEKMHLNNMTNRPYLSTKPLAGGHELYNFGRFFLVPHYYILNLFEPCPRVEKKIFKENINLTLLTPKLQSLAGGGGGQNI